MCIQHFFPPPTHRWGLIDGIIDSHLTVLLVEKVEQIFPTSFQDFTTKTKSFGCDVGPKVVVGKLSLSKGFSTVISQVEDSDFDAQPK